MKKILSSPFFAAVVGGAIVAAVMLIAGIGNTTTETIVEQGSSGADASATSGGEMTPRTIYQRDAPGVVFVTATVIQHTQSVFDLFPSTTRGTSTGSGFVINRDGVILTNAHVISGAVRISVAFADNQTVTATVIGKDPDDDLALLKVNPDGLTLEYSFGMEEFAEDGAREARQLPFSMDILDSWGSAPLPATGKGGAVEAASL